ncbi:MAG TPA: hypothetical protein VNS29_04075 [Burkholderiaceae bacterium]|nr:hypothetical protein [Burkholderiaceae bacterium]
METVTVDAKALRSVLAALTGPGHLIRELQVLRGLGDAMDSPIDLLISQYNKAVESHNAASV